MAQTGYTPILIYSSSTTTNAPAAGSLTNSTLGSELAINITDGKLFYKDNANNVQVIAWKVTPTTAGGTGLTTYAAGDLLFYASGTALSKLTIGASTTVLTSSGSAPQWTAQSALSVGTAANLLSNATTGVMQITGPGTGTTRVMTIPNANFTAARTDAAQTFTGLQTLNGGAQIPSGKKLLLGTTGFLAEVYYNANGNLSLSPRSGFNTQLDAGNLIVANGNGIDFSATPGTGTSELFADYEEGTWTPVISDGTNNATMSANAQGVYTKIGRQVTVIGQVETTSLGSVTGSIRITGLPFTNAAGTPRYSSGTIGYAELLNITAGQSVGIGVFSGNNYISMFLWDSAAGVTPLQASEWSSDGTAAIQITYFV